MTRLRAFLIALTILAMAVAPVLVSRTIGLESTSDSRAYASVAAAPMQQDDGDNDDDDDDGDNDDDDDDDDDGDNDDDDGDNDDDDDVDDDNDDGDDDNDNDGDGGDDDDNDDGDNDNDGDDGGAVSPPPAPPSQPASGCTTPGQEMGIQSADLRVGVWVYGSMSQSVRLKIQLPIDGAAVPPAPGPVVSDLFFEVIAYTCDGNPIPVLPAEVNLAVNYSDTDLGSLDEGRLALARLNTGTNLWQDVAKQATDLPNNYTSATITEMGYYVLYQRP